MSRRLIAVLALILVACERQGPATAPITINEPGAPSATQIAAPTESFAFLPPLGTGVEDPTRFDAVAAPTVEICAWDGSACSAPPFAVFSTAPSGTMLPLVINTAIGRYEGSLDLLNSRFLTRQTYRIRVLQGAAELGAVSVDIVRGRWALTRSDGSLAPLAAASSLPIRFGILTPSSNQPPTATITSPTGGSFVQGDPIAFSGSATDPEDGTLTGAALVWSSDRDGQIGTGASFSLNTLSVGTHLITLRATDSQGASGTASVSITVTQPTSPGVLANGATVTGRIGLAHQVDQWTFSATAGDRAVLSLGGIANSVGYVPWLRILDPNGTEVASNLGNAAAQVEFTTTLTGTYKVLVASADFGGVGTGDYRLTLIKAPGALTVSSGDQGGTLANGATMSGNLYTGDIDGWTLAANAGDHVVVSLGETTNSSGMSPWLRIIGPDGAVVGSNFGTSAAQLEFGAVLAGSYTVIVGSAASGFTGTGDYRLTFMKGPGSLTVSSGDQGGPLTNGATHTGTLYLGDIDGWTFSANAGDHAVISVGETSNSSGFSPWLRVIGPTGTVVASNFGTVAAQVEMSGLAAGTYTVVVGSAAGGFTGTGDYLLTLVRAPGALSVSSGDQGGALTNGGTHAGTLYDGDIDAWTFTADAGDYAVVSLGETTNSTGMFPWLRVVGPDGSIVGSNFGTFAAQVDLNSLAAGTYTVIVGSAGGGFTGSGDYLLTLVKAPGALTVSTGDHGGTLINGATHSGTLYDGDVDGWTFTAAAGDHAVISLGETINSNGLFPWLRVIGPTGNVVGSNFGTSAAQLELANLAAGDYTVIVGSAGSGFTGNGDYLLTMLKAPGALTVSSGDQGGALINGVSRAGNLYTGDVDGWTFAAGVGDAIALNLTKGAITSGFTPWLRVVGPTGTVVGGNLGNVSAQVQFVASAAGTYTVIVASAAGGFTGTGDYNIMLSGSTAVSALRVAPPDGRVPPTP